MGWIVVSGERQSPLSRPYGLRGRASGVTLWFASPQERWEFVWTQTFRNALVRGTTQDEQWASFARAFKFVRPTLWDRVRKALHRGRVR